MRKKIELFLCLFAAIVASASAARDGLAQQLAPAAPPQAAHAPQDPAFSVAEHVNEALPEWLRFGGEYRLRFEGATSIRGTEGNDDAYVLSRLRLNLLFKFGSHLRAFVEGQDSQAGGFDANPDPPVHQNDLDVRQAYVEIRQADTTGWGLRVGRQELAFGDQRLVGPSNWTNTARSFDAVRLSYTEARIALDLFASSVVAVQDDHFDKHVDGQNFYGVHASLLTLVPKTRVDAYTFWKTSPLVVGESARPGDADTWTFGTRVAGALAPRAGYTVELTGQRGSFASDAIRAGSVQARLDWATSSRAAGPKVRVEYNYASGDARPGDGVRGTFDQLYPSNHDKYGVMDQVGTKNLHDVRVGVSAKATPRLGLEASYYSFWLAERRDGLYDAGGNLVARIAAGAASAHVAQEADVQAAFSLAPNVALGAGYGHWFPGAFWREATPGAARNFVYSMITYRF